VLRRGDTFVFWGAGLPAGDPAEGRLAPLAPGAGFFLPSAHPDRIWIPYFDRGSPATAPRFTAIREVDATGRVTVAGEHPPRGWPERAAAAGILLSQRRPRHLVWDPRTRTVVNVLRASRLGDLGPVHGDTLASCTWPCRALRLTDVRTGAQRRVRAPAGLRFEPSYATFSSTGGELAIPVASGRTRRLALVKTEAPAAVKPVPGSKVPEGYVLTAFSSDDRHVFITGGHGKRAVIKCYDRSRATARTVSVETGPFYGAAAG
jgi:hypothetical protein